MVNNQNFGWETHSPDLHVLESSGDEGGESSSIQTSQTSTHGQGDVSNVGGDEDDDERDEDEEGPTTLLTSGNPPLLAATVTHIALLPEYPQTSERGYAFCVYIDPSRSSPERILADALVVQYCKKQKGPAKRTQCPYIKGAAMRHRYACTGVKVCQYLDNALSTFSHTHITPETWEQMRVARFSAYRGETDIRKKKAASLYMTLTARFASRTACISPKDTCSPIVRRQRTENVAGPHSWYIGCASWSWRTRTTERHYFRMLRDKYDVEHLQTLFHTGLHQDDGPRDTCGVVLSTRTGLKGCDFNHPQGDGKLQQVVCNVQFNILIPLDLDQNPFFIFHSIGTHNHAPPPPTKTPETLTEEIVDLIRRSNDPSLTVASFLRGPLLEELCKRHNKSSWGQIHATLNNLDRLRMTIYREELIMFPAGQDLADVQFEMRKQPSISEDGYIREISTHPLGNIILTMQKEQAAVFARLETFQLDLSFKRVGYGWHELLVAHYNEPQGKLFTLCRIYMTSQRRRLYSKAFQMLFSWINTITSVPVTWRHLHGTGMIGVTVDMDGRQMGGFGRYLRTQDPLDRDWRWQLRHTVKFCQAHFKRSITTVCSSITWTSTSVHTRMEGLLTVNDWAEFQELCGQLVENETPSIGNWARNMNTLVIASGLNKNITLMSQESWYKLEETSSHIEQTGKKSYSYGNKLHLWPAIMMGMKLDDGDINQISVREEFGARLSFQSTAVEARYETGMRRDNRKRSRAETVEEDDGFAENADEQALFQASSSEYTRRRPSQKRRQSETRQVSPGPSGSSSSPASSRMSSQPVTLASRTPSVEPTLQQQASEQNADAQAKQTELELREREARVRRLELENMKLELEVAAMRRALE